MLPKCIKHQAWIWEYPGGNRVYMVFLIRVVVMPLKTSDAIALAFSSLNKSWSSWMSQTGSREMTSSPNWRIRAFWSRLRFSWASLHSKPRSHWSDSAGWCKGLFLNILFKLSKVFEKHKGFKWITKSLYFIGRTSDDISKQDGVIVYLPRASLL